MSAYTVWNPWLLSVKPPSVELFVTLAELAYIGRGTDAFVAGCLQAAKVGGPVASWSLDRFRASYFSEYPESEDWEDRWQPVWRLRAEMAPEPPTLLGDSIDGQYPLDATDDSWSRKTSIVHEPAAPCLVLADFRTEAMLAAAQTKVTEHAPVATCWVGHAMGRFWQLRIGLPDLPGEQYEQDAPVARELERLCVELGGTTHYQRSVAAKLASRS